MAREKKPIQLRTVEEAPVEEAEVLRLGGNPTVLRVIPEGRDVRPPPDARLEVPDREDPLRSHEPGVDALIEAEMASLITDETQWGAVATERVPLPWGWFALLGLVLAGAVVWSLNFVIRANHDVKQVHHQATKSAAGSEETDREIMRSLDLMDQTVRTFCEAKSIEEILPTVRHPERVRPLMEAYYADKPFQPLGFVRKKDFQGASLGGSSNFWLFKIVIGNRTTKRLLVEQESPESCHVDWETAVTYQPMPWDRYAAERPVGTTLDFRVNLQEDYFFSHEFADSTQWDSFRLTTPTGEETLFGYARKNSMESVMLLNLLKENEGKQVPVILRLRLPPGMQTRRGVIIDKVLSSRWIYVVPPDSDS